MKYRMTPTNRLGFSFNKNPLMTVLSKTETVKFLRWAVDAATSHVLTLTPPYVITASLEYDDLSTDQPTPAYTWAVIVKRDLKLAKEIMAAVAVETKLAGFDAGVNIPPIPELQFNLKTLAPVCSVETALTDLRTVLFDHSTSVAYRPEYWEALGFTPQGAKQVEAVLNNYKDHSFDTGKGEFKVDKFNAYIKEHTTGPMCLRLLIWAAGNSITKIKSVI